MPVIYAIDRTERVVYLTTAGDFSVIELSQHSGWVVTGHHPDILNYVSPDEVEAGASDERTRQRAERLLREMRRAGAAETGEQLSVECLAGGGHRLLWVLERG